MPSAESAPQRRTARFGATHLASGPTVLRLLVTCREICLTAPVRGGRPEKSRARKGKPARYDERLLNRGALGQTRAHLELMAFLRYRSFWAAWIVPIHVKT